MEEYLLNVKVKLKFKEGADLDLSIQQLINSGDVEFEIVECSMIDEDGIDIADEANSEDYTELVKDFLVGGAE